MNLGAEPIAEHQNAVDKLLRHLDALGGREAEHPKNHVIIVPSQTWGSRASGLVLGVVSPGELAGSAGWLMTPW
jgi:hypothetical protein